MAGSCSCVSASYVQVLSPGAARTPGSSPTTSTLYACQAGGDRRPPPGTWDLHGRTGRTTDPAWAARRRLLRGWERPSPRQFTKMWNDLMDGDPSEQILTAWIAKKELAALHLGFVLSDVPNTCIFMPTESIRAPPDRPGSVTVSPAAPMPGTQPTISPTRAPRQRPGLDVTTRHVVDGVVT